MERRSLLGAMIAAAVAGAADAQTTKRPIQLNCDLGVDPKNDDAFIKHLDTVFRPVAKKHEGYIDLKLLRLNTAIRGNVPNGCRFRFSLTFQSEALRQ